MAEVRASLQSVTDFLNAKLSQRIVYWVFLSIVVIEVIILVPSVLRRERELLGYLRSLSTAQSVGLLDGEDLTTLTREELFNRVAAIETNDLILGGTLYGPEGELLGSFGEPPELTLQESLQGWQQDRYRRWQDRYDAPWDMPLLEGQYVLIVRHDAAWVRKEFFAFIGRIAGLVVIISVFVTGATLFVLRRILIKPILQLRQDLLKAGEAIRDDSDTRTLEFESLQTVRDDELGDVISAFDQMFGQITEAIATRKQSENRFRTLVEQAADAFFVVDRAGRVIDVNQSACNSLGYDREALLKLSVPNIHTAIDEMAFQRLWHQLQPGTPQTLEGWHQRQDGSCFPVEVRLGLLDTNQHRYILALARDITERKASEKAMARLAEIGELAAMIVHEVRSPLTTVLMGLNSFRSLDLSERARRRLELALEESNRLQNLLNEILQYARQQTLECHPLELNQLVRDTKAALQDNPIVCRQGITLQLPESAVFVEADRDKLKQVFINLVTNACEASGEGEEVTWTVHLPVRNQVTVTVHNSGEPIPANLLPKLTQPFFTTKSSGNGLGLAITKRIIEAHQGDFSITSSAAAGTIATVTLPLVTHTQEALSATPTH
jgi:PAS domain S-box-containing protein